MLQSSTDEFSTVRATWDVIISYKIQDADNIIPDKVIASFMHYQDCYVFMKGIAVADGVGFSEFHPRHTFATRNGLFEYSIVTRDVYIGKAKP